ncbi:MULTISPECIES: hypothetical protein [unclassified Rathayibacter]|uniref:hypothetical protein n=1 Tax=unclassified Rathayibacter TaxID=2609250 RepID=UPI000CE7AF3F|nr:MULTISPECIES: hypothetical protein [unclassified Rathayibacter]PPF27257.1 hypothetical protein C5C54_10040 [Rathayibacter sp. AY1F2]PPF74402.1 hypothetical protein C5C46_01780 [Rathayibacter sp. AY1E6]PPG53902.1 hypothetical protein C5C41_06005 [Rathayibacter sp. AY1E9]PPH16558.1 hypothetical protein C5C35_10180 [Rathayibacter sp. AY1F8]PPH29003.1 hypothetical protein C5C37_09340 [Rathayibacter sp. AY1F9]
MTQHDPTPSPESRPLQNGFDAVEEHVLSDELLRIEQTPLNERAAGYVQLQEQLRIRLENADRDR